MIMTCQNNLYYIRMILSEPTQPNVQNVIPLLCLYVSMFMKFNYKYRNAGNF